jgi:hypothetical protein
MRSLIVGLLLVIAFGLLTEVEARQTQHLEVRINREKTAARSRLRVKFVKLVEDSRCPVDTNCVWAGNAKIKIRVAKNGRSRTLELNSNTGPKVADFAGYSFKLAGLMPQPRSNIRIDRNGYVASIEIVKLR